MKICIDFQGGAHGNFLEFVCNVIAGVETNNSPFNSLGASHNKTYYSDKIFYADHYSFMGYQIDSNKVISIKISPDDLLQLTSISLLRAGDYGYDNNELEINTYHKFNNKEYRWVLDTLINSFFSNQIETSYNRVKDESWPDIHSIADFEALPTHIKQECIDVHNLQLLELSESRPDCPRHILREFFQIGFMNPEQQGFIMAQNKMQYPESTDVYNFPFDCFYNTDRFVAEIKHIASWARIQYNEWQEIVKLHAQFLEKQPYKNSKLKCDQIVQQIIRGNIPPAVNLFEEAYINAMLLKSGYECRY